MFEITFQEHFSIYHYLLLASHKGWVICEHRVCNLLDNLLKKNSKRKIQKFYEKSLLLGTILIWLFDRIWRSLKTIILYDIFSNTCKLLSQGRKDGFCWLFIGAVYSKVQSTYKINLPTLNSFHIHANKQKKWIFSILKYHQKKFPSYNFLWVFWYSRSSLFPKHFWITAFISKLHIMTHIKFH